MLYPSEDEWLRLRIKATNRANDLANKIHQQMTEFFRRYVGQKVVNADGCWTKKLGPLIPRPIGEGQSGVHVYKSNDYNQVSWKVRVIEFTADGQDHVDAESWTYVLLLEGDKLKELRTMDMRRTDYDYATVKAARELAKVKKKEYDEAQSACYPFEERH